MGFPEIRVVESMSAIDSTIWDKLADSPFMTHAFLNVLETSGSVGPSSGWQPLHMIMEKEGELIAGAPLYLKNHSYGEYIFDWGWAEASQRAGIPYYPKLVCAVPFTPATGNRLLGSADDQKKLWQGMKQLSQMVEANSIHALFVSPSEKANLITEAGTHGRITHQYHWRNRNFKTFEDHLSQFKSRDRKKIKKERQKAAAAVDDIRHIKGADLTQNDIDTLWGFYQDTCSRKWGEPYLTKGFFNALKTDLAEMTLIFAAVKNQETVAMALCFQRGNRLYGRYWGCSDQFDCLHFELCCHQPIQWCIEKGLGGFEAGAQGSHKLKRGLMPAPIHSIHWFAHPGLSQGVGRFLEDEKKRVEMEMVYLSSQGPYRKENT